MRLHLVDGTYELFRAHFSKRPPHTAPGGWLVVGWVDADRRCGTLAVGIRTFEWRQGRLHLGTGAGITWGSDPRREWDETELKVRTLLAVR